MREEPTDWRTAAIVWWAIIWRGLLLGTAAGFMVGLVFALVGPYTGVDKTTLDSVATWIAALAGIAANIWVIRRLMDKGFGRYRLAIVLQGP